MANVTIGCRLPHGLVLEVYENGVSKGSVTLKGKNDQDSEIIILRPKHCGFTEVDESFWNAWVKANPDFPALKSGAIFQEKTLKDAKAANDDLKAEATGFEPAEAVMTV